MVFSHLNKSIEYLETREIDPEDMEHISPLYEIKIYDKSHVIALGKAKYTFSSKFDVIFFPIYLILVGKSNEKKGKKDKLILGKIGVYEIERNRLISVMDKKKEVKVSILGEPLLFKKTTEAYMEKTNSIFVFEELVDEPEVEEPLVEGSDEGVDDTAEDDVLSLQKPKKGEKEKGKKEDKKEKHISLEDVFTKDKTQPNITTWPTETEEDAKKEKINYDKNKSANDNWVQTFMRNKNYAIERNEGGGDCFFAVIRDAFQEIGYHTTVQKLRTILSQEVTLALFENLIQIYQGIVSGNEISQHEVEMIVQKNKVLKKQTGGLSKDKMPEMLAGAKELKKKYGELKKKTDLDDELLGEFAYMKNIKTIEDLRTFILTSSYWADTWAISTLERLLEVKIIIMEDTTDPNAVMLCGQLNDEISTFSPKYYIIANYTGGNHYELITYKKKKIFVFSEIPYDIKILVVNKCMERNAGPYSIIPAFRQFQSDLGLEVVESEESASTKSIEETGLYDDKYQFMFYHKSDSSKKPGDGTGEKSIPKNELSMFIGLIQKPPLAWRQQLDDMWSETPFTLEHHRWASVAHYLLALPFEKTEPAIFKEFSLDGNHLEMAKDIKLAKEAIDKKKGKEGTYYTKYKIVSGLGERGEEENENARKTALMAKFSQNANLTTMLLNTRNALLKQYHPGKEAEADILLMKVRKELLGK
jgi:predicted NAD-dependent protein-ADP-ribosyltransferase YbiA (DUF1768 family)